MIIVQRFRRLVQQKLYREETGFLLNYLTLNISDPAIDREKSLHRGNKSRSFVNPMLIVCVISFLITVYGLYIKESE